MDEILKQTKLKEEQEEQERQRKVLDEVAKLQEESQKLRESWQTKKLRDVADKQLKELEDEERKRILNQAQQRRLTEAQTRWREFDAIEKLKPIETNQETEKHLLNNLLPRGSVTLESHQIPTSASPVVAASNTEPRKTFNGSQSVPSRPTNSSPLSYMSPRSDKRELTSNPVENPPMPNMRTMSPPVQRPIISSQTTRHRAESLHPIQLSTSPTNNRPNSPLKTIIQTPPPVLSSTLRRTGESPAKKQEISQIPPSTQPSLIPTTVSAPLPTVSRNQTLVDLRKPSPLTASEELAMSRRRLKEDHNDSQALKSKLIINYLESKQKEIEAKDQEVVQKIRNEAEVRKRLSGNNQTNMLIEKPKEPVVSNVPMRTLPSNISPQNRIAAPVYNGDSVVINGNVLTAVPVANANYADNRRATISIQSGVTYNNPNLSLKTRMALFEQKYSEILS